jgi:hypothetical protein
MQGAKKVSYNQGKKLSDYLGEKVLTIAKFLQQ